jgi:hypothetical protein
MKTIRALFYVTPRFKWKYWVNWLISIRTMSKYSHCELWIPDGAFFFKTVSQVLNPDDAGFAGTTYSSTMRGKSNGTRKQDASLTLKHPEHWHYIEIPVGEVNYKYMISWMELQVKNNKGYAKWDILKFVSPIHFPDDERNICSEFCNNALWWAQKGLKHGIISPKALLKKLLKLGLKVRPLVNSGPTQQDIDDIITEVNG